MLKNGNADITAMSNPVKPNLLSLSLKLESICPTSSNSPLLPYTTMDMIPEAETTSINNRYLNISQEVLNSNESKLSFNGVNGNPNENRKNNR